MFGSKAPPPPAVPAPLPSPPTYASQAKVVPNTNIGRFGSLSETILTGPMGVTTPASTQRKVLLGA